MSRRLFGAKLFWGRCDTQRCWPQRIKSDSAHWVTANVVDHGHPWTSLHSVIIPGSPGHPRRMNPDNLERMCTIMRSNMLHIYTYLTYIYIFLHYANYAKYADCSGATVLFKMIAVMNCVVCFLGSWSRLTLLQGLGPCSHHFAGWVIWLQGGSGLS